MNAYLIKHYRWLGPLFLLILLAPLSEALDLSISRYFYDPTEMGDRRFEMNTFNDFLFHWGPLPAWLTVFVCFLIAIGSYKIKKWQSWRYVAFIPIFVLAIGSGFIVHVLLKDQWGRPRPRQVLEFGGEQSFRPFYQPNFDNHIPSKSFACGHCSTGFFFFVFSTLGIYLKKRWLTYMGFLLAFGWGGILSYTRIAQGAHFFSDTVAAAIVMWWSSLMICWLTFRSSHFLQALVQNQQVSVYDDLKSLE